jgi:predicted ATPase
MGVTIFRDGKVDIFGRTSSLRPRPKPHLLKKPQLDLLDEMHWIYAVLTGVRLLGKRPIRQSYTRSPSFLQVSDQGTFSTSSFFSLGVDSLARKISRMKTEEFNEFGNICHRMGLASEITVEKFTASEDPKKTTKEKNKEYIISVLLDRVNIGLLSDGTLQVLSLLIELITSSLSVTTMIEEPETQIHPGMLAKLLNEIEAYTFGQNLILSTHSPQVVAWTSPAKLNLVYRNNGQTIVRKLDEEEMQKVIGYLYEEGDLGEWVYSGILDE